MVRGSGCDGLAALAGVLGLGLKRAIAIPSPRSYPEAKVGRGQSFAITLETLFVVKGFTPWKLIVYSVHHSSKDLTQGAICRGR